MPTPENRPVGRPTMRCLNCGNTGPFVLIVELTVLACNAGAFSEPDWTLALQCAACASTDVDGDPVAMLAARID